MATSQNINTRNKQLNQVHSSSQQSQQFQQGQNKEKSKEYDEDELIYYDQFCECQDYVIEECLEQFELTNLSKQLPIDRLSRYNKALLQNIIKQIYQQVQQRLKKRLSDLQDTFQIKDELVKIQRIKQEQQILQQLGYSDNIVGQDENQVFFELLLKNMKLLSIEAQVDQESKLNKRQQ